MTKSLRMEIAIEVMKVLLEKDFKNLSYSARVNGNTNITEYLVSESFSISEEMIKRDGIEPKETNE